MSDARRAGLPKAKLLKRHLKFPRIKYTKPHGFVYNLN